MSLQNLFFKNISAKQTVFKNSFWLFFSQGISKLLKLFLVLAAARILGPTNFGAFNYLLAVASMFFLFSDWGISPLVIRDYQQKVDKEKYVRVAVGLKMALVVLSFVAALIGLFFFHSPIFKTTLILLAFFLVLSNGRDFIIYLFRAFQKMEKEFWLVVAENLSLLILGVFLLLIYKNIISLAVAYFFSMFISLIIGLSLIKRYSFYFKPIFDVHLIKELFRNGTPMMLYGFLSFLFFATDQILLAKLKGTTEVGYYSIVTKIILFVNIVPGLIMTALLPYLSSQVAHKDKIKKIFRKVGSGFVLFGAALAIIGFFSAPLLPFIVGSQYAPSVPLLRFFVWILIFMFPTALLDIILFIYNKQWLNFGFTAFCALANLALDFLLIPHYGMFGAAAASIMAQFLNLVITLYLSRRVMNSALALSYSSNNL